MKLSGPPDKLSFGLIALLTALSVAAWVSGMPWGRSTEPMIGPVFMGFFLVALGVMFFASYFYSDRSFFLRWLLRFSTGFPSFPNPKMAFFWSFVSVLCGLDAIADGLGWHLI
jgi:hypothetical protein